MGDQILHRHHHCQRCPAAGKFVDVQARMRALGCAEMCSAVRPVRAPRPRPKLYDTVMLFKRLIRG